jgi:hypothetical protein
MSWEKFAGTLFITVQKKKGINQKARDMGFIGLLYEEEGLNTNPK